MRVLIENYRGHAIVFDPENEKFSFSFDIENWNQKQSFSSCKKAIDDYVKENETFEPFLVEELEYGTMLKQLNIVGIRNDGRFCFDNGGKDKGQISSYDERDYYLVNPANIPIYEQIQQLEKEINVLVEKQVRLRSGIVKKTLADIRNETGK